MNYTGLVRRKDKALGLFTKAKTALTKVKEQVETRKTQNTAKVAAMKAVITSVENENDALAMETGAIDRSIQKIDEILDPQDIFPPVKGKDAE